MAPVSPLKTENDIWSAAYNAAERFLGVDRNDWRARRASGGVHFSSLREPPSAKLHRAIVSHKPNVSSSFCPQPAHFDLHLRTDWHDAVYVRGFAHLGPPVVGSNALFLHVEAEYRLGDAKVASAYWTHGGKNVKNGFVAFTRDYWSEEINAWAVGTTASRAVKRLERGLRDAAAMNLANPPISDADLAVLQDF